MPFISGMPRLLSLEEIPLIKGNGGAAAYRWNAALNRWTECHAVLLTPLWPTKSHFHAALPSQVAIFEHEAVRSGGQRPETVLAEYHLSLYSRGGRSVSMARRPRRCVGRSESKPHPSDGIEPPRRQVTPNAHPFAK